MTKKMQQLIDDLKKELTDFGDRIENQLASLLSCNETKTEKLRAYLLSQGMPPALEVHRKSDEDKYIVCQIKRNGCIVMTISLGTTGIASAELNDFVYLNTFAAMNLVEYEQLNRDFITAIRFFEKLNYEALYATNAKIDFHSYDRLHNQFRYIRDLKFSLSHFKDCMAETFKDDEK